MATAAYYPHPTMTPSYSHHSSSSSSSSSHSHSKRGYRLCDQCGAVEAPGARFRLCGGCMTTQYCSQECQKHHWPGHKAICQHTTSQLHSFAQQSTDDNLAKHLRKFTSAHTALLSWAGYQALKVPSKPSSIRTHALLIELQYRSSSSDSARRFTVAQTHVVPTSYVRDAMVLQDIQRRDERCRAAGGLGAMVVLIQCGGVSQVMPVEVDNPKSVGWGVREEWEGVLRGWVDAGRTDFRGY